MKKTIVICLAGAVGFSAPLLHAEPVVASAKQEAASSDTISAYVLKIQGAG